VVKAEKSIRCVYTDCVWKITFELSLESRHLTHWFILNNGYWSAFISIHHAFTASIIEYHTICYKHKCSATVQLVCKSQHLTVNAPQEVVDGRFIEQEDKVEDVVDYQPSHVLGVTQILTLNTHSSLPSARLSKVEQGLTSHQTHYRSYWGRVFMGQVTQPTVSSKHWSKIGPKD